MRDEVLAAPLAAAMMISAGTGYVMGRDVTEHFCYSNSNCRVAG